MRMRYSTSCIRPGCDLKKLSGFNFVETICRKLRKTSVCPIKDAGVPISIRKWAIDGPHRLRSVASVNVALQVCKKAADRYQAQTNRPSPTGSLIWVLYCFATTSGIDGPQFFLKKHVYSFFVSNHPIHPMFFSRFRVLHQ